jgi:hypothetical protein
MTAKRISRTAQSSLGGVKFPGSGLIAGHTEDRDGAIMTARGVVFRGGWWWFDLS